MPGPKRANKGARLGAPKIGSRGAGARGPELKAPAVGAEDVRVLAVQVEVARVPAVRVEDAPVRAEAARAEVPMHPELALYAKPKKPRLPPCVHYAGQPKLIDKALQLQAERGGHFDVTLDLEDGAAAGQERALAEHAAEVLSRPRPTACRVGVRVHDPSHPAFLEDLRIVSVASAQIAFWVVPKVHGVEDVNYAAAAIHDAHRARGQGLVAPLHVLIESHGALADVRRIAAVPQVETLDFGLMDFISDHQGAIPAECMRSPGQFEHALVRRAKVELAAAALAYGKTPVHNVTLALRDPAQVESDARRARKELGFLRMWSVHPLQIDPILRGLAPSDDEIKEATAVLELAEAKDWAPIEHRGQLHDRASYRYDWDLLEEAHRAGRPLPEVALRWFSGR